eukprot:CAMPEP_0180151240 /NCGR_PEP_ID=MMETSP0986-20121125/22001_1 /TAXON_ID=697907 /ORGANISM="non described non described, Strain CCMP2293" /LENGTH=330 /DNA_ID=CAMNT_0022098477 /DNA_START=7 /DNA_END=999 /DNA_ORIENTATION=+
MALNVGLLVAITVPSIWLLLVLIPIIARLVKGKKSYKGKHVLITGGSSGIGLCLAEDFALKGSHVTILARTEATLKAAVETIKKKATNPGQKINFVAVDLSDAAATVKAVQKAEEMAGPLDVAIANAGASVPGYFMQQDAKVFEKSMSQNFLSAVHLAKAAAPGMCERRSGQIVFVASGAAVVSFIGYSTYSPTKWAMRGLGDTLRNELLGFGVTVHVGYPPDTKTPGFEEEEKSKPIECSRFSNFIGGSAFDPKQVAAGMVSGMEWGMYHLPSPDFIQNRMVETMAGVSPRANPVLEWTFLPLFSIIEWLTLFPMDHFGMQYGRKAKRS